MSSTDIITLQHLSVRSRLKVTDGYFTHQAHCSCTLDFSTQTTAAAFSASITRHCYRFGDSTPLLALSSHQFHSQLKTFLFGQFFPPKSHLHQLLLVLWPLDLANGFHLAVIFTLSFIITSFIYTSVCKKPPSVIAAWQAL